MELIQVEIVRLQPFETLLQILLSAPGIAGHRLTGKKRLLAVGCQGHTEFDLCLTPEIAGRDIEVIHSVIHGFGHYSTGFVRIHPDNHDAAEPDYRQFDVALVGSPDHRARLNRDCSFTTIDHLTKCYTPLK
jgi:hypothetical protein